MVHVKNYLRTLGIDHGIFAIAGILRRQESAVFAKFAKTFSFFILDLLFSLLNVDFPETLNSFKMLKNFKIESN